jgi:protein-disulfide isomerase
MSNERIWQVLAAVAVSCLTVMTVILVKREFAGTPTYAAAAASVPMPNLAAEPPVPVADWRSVSSVGHRIGPADAPVTIVEFSDFECPFCARFAQQTFPALQRRFQGQVALLYRHWPLSNHRYAYPAARAAECAAAQGRFQAMHDLLFEQREQLGTKTFGVFAREAGVADPVAFDACFDAPGPVPAIERDIAEARRIGGRGTPTLVVNGMLMRPPYSEEALALQIEAALADVER